MANKRAITIDFKKIHWGQAIEFHFRINTFQLLMILRFFDF